MRPAVSVLFCIWIALGNFGCSVNIFETFADKTTNEALYENALKLIREGDYTSAIAEIAKMKGAYPALPRVISLKASAFAGRCGLDFIGFAQTLAGIGATRLFPFLVDKVRGGTTTKIDDCETAENLIESIGAVAARSNDDNIFLVMVNFMKIGNILSLYADAPAQDGVGDVGFDACVVNGSRTVGSFSDADARQLGSALTLAIEALTQVGSSINLGSGSLAAVSGACGLLTGGLAAYNFCAVTDPAAFTANQVKGIRSLVKEDSAVGLGTNCTGDLSACNCP